MKKHFRNGTEEFLKIAIMGYTKRGNKNRKPSRGSGMRKVHTCKLHPKGSSEMTLLNRELFGFYFCAK